MERRRSSLTAALTVGLALGCCVARAQQGFDPLADAFGRDAEVELHFRTYYFDRLNPGGVTHAAWAIGGWAGYRTGWIGDAVRFGVVGYTSQPLWAPLDKQGSLLLAPPQDAYSTIGQAYVSLKLVNQVLTGGRFLVDQPEINPQDNRMTPITYSGGALAGNVAGLDYYAAYLNAIKPRNSEDFINFVAAADIPGSAGEPLYLFGLSGQPQKDLRWQYSSYYVPDVLSSNYADVAWSAPLQGGHRLRLGAQAMYQRGVGGQLLTGAPFSTWSGGLKADLTSGGATLSLAYQQTGSGSAYQTPYAAWAGYTYMIVKSFNLAGMRAWLLGGSYDFAGLDVPGLALNGAIVHGWNAIDASNGAAQPNWTEYDLTLDYRFKASRWPEWARPLWIRGRAAFVDQGTDGNIQDYRIVVNYEWIF